MTPNEIHMLADRIEGEPLDTDALEEIANSLRELADQNPTWQDVVDAIPDVDRTAARERRKKDVAVAYSQRCMEKATEQLSGWIDNGIVELEEAGEAIGMTMALQAGMLFHCYTIDIPRFETSPTEMRDALMQGVAKMWPFASTALIDTPKETN